MAHRDNDETFLVGTMQIIQLRESLLENGANKVHGLCGGGEWDVKERISSGKAW